MERRRPEWPSFIYSLASLLEYLETCQPVALYRSEHGSDFRSPQHNWIFDLSAYTIEDGTRPFTCVLFGRVKNAPALVDGHCTLVLDCGCTQIAAACEAFEAQIKVLTGLVAKDNVLHRLGSTNMRVVPWTDADPSTQGGGETITVHTAHTGGTHCVVYTPTDDMDEFEVDQPQRATDYPFKAGDWIVASATLHRRESGVERHRSYEILARHVRVFPSDMFDLEAHRTAVRAATPAVVAAPRAAQRDATTPGAPPSSPPTMPFRRGKSPASTSGPRTRSRTKELKRTRGPDEPNEALEDLKTPGKRRRREPSLPESITSPEAESNTTAQALSAMSATQGGIQRLPDELLGAIAEAAIGADTDPWYNVRATRDAIIHISKRWKNIAYSQSSLWRYITVHRCTPPTFLETCLKRSGSLAVVLAIDGQPHKHLPTGDGNGTMRRVGYRSLSYLVEEILELLRSQFTRVSSLEVICAEQSSWSTIMGALARYNPAGLTILEISLHQWDIQEGLFDPNGREFMELPLWVALPPIRTMSVCTVLPIWRSAAAYTELTVLKLFSIHPPVAWHHLLAVLNSAIRLRVLMVTHVDLDDLSTAASITLPSLRDFRITDSGHSTLEIASKMDLPGIELLSVDAYGGGSIANVYRMNPRMFHAAQHLEIRAEENTEEEWLPILQAPKAGPSGGLVATKQGCILGTLDSAQEVDLRRCDYRFATALLRTIRETGWSLPSVKVVQLPSVITLAQASTVLSAFAADCQVYSPGGPHTSTRSWLEASTSVTAFLPISQDALQLYAEREYFAANTKFQLKLVVIRRKDAMRVETTYAEAKLEVLAAKTRKVEIRVLVRAIDSTPRPLGDLLAAQSVPPDRRARLSARSRPALRRRVENDVLRESRLRKIGWETYLSVRVNKAENTAPLMSVRTASSTGMNKRKPKIVEKVNPLASVEVGRDDIKVIGYSRVAANDSNSQRNGADDPTASVEEHVEKRVEFRALHDGGKIVADGFEEGGNVSGYTAAQDSLAHPIETAAGLGEGDEIEEAEEAQHVHDNVICVQKQVLENGTWNYAGDPRASAS
ncbi:hypothetical protein B0H11DRAFT_1930260 [Mycena galericulata]|nr:hypothetical protein B0H11DRAFT_1930260 [Mycena galericulata]